jgi:hypothetical protein
MQPDPAFERRRISANLAYVKWVAFAMPILPLAVFQSWLGVILALAFGVFGAMNVLFYSTPEVYVTTTLIIREGESERNLPFSSIVDISESRWLNPKRITIRMDDGQTFRFIPRSPRSRIGPHPVAEELRDLAGLPWKS